MQNSMTILKFPETKKTKESLTDILKKLNYKKRIKLRAKKIAKSGYSLYLDIYYNNRRNYQFLKLYILGKSETKKQDNENLKLAFELRDKKELELFQNEHGFELSNYKLKANFVEYFKSLVDSKRSSIKPWINTYKHLYRFTKGNVSFQEVDENFCGSFKKYLLSNVSQNSAHTYFARLKASLYTAVKNKIIKQNPAQFIQVKKEEVQREFLTEEELKILLNTDCSNVQTKRAFLFTCFTGLRYSDVSTLTFDEIKSNYLEFRQVKTKGIERIKLSKDALKIIDMQRSDGLTDGKLFSLQSHSNTNLHIKALVSAAKINKSISWHNGRHTHATMLINNDVDLYVVSKLLGHREIKTTQIYAQLVDKKKDDAIDRLPQIS